MALVTYGGGVTEFRGSIGGITYSRNAMGTYAKVRTKPRVPISTPGNFSSTILAFSSGAWAVSLTDNQRIDWNTLAANTVWQNALGENYNPTGLNLWIRATALATLANQAVQVVAPGAADEASPDFVLDNPVGGGLRITDFDILASPPLGTLLTWCSGPQSLSVYSWFGPWSFLRWDRINALAAPEVWIADGDLTLDRRYYFRFRIIREDGTASHRFHETIDALV